MKLKEIRVRVDNLKAYEARRIQTMCRAISMIFLSELKNYVIKDTHILNVYFRADSAHQENHDIINLGEKMNGNIGIVTALFDSVYFFSLDNNGKRQFLLERIKFALLKFAKHFGLAIDPIEEAFEKLTESALMVKNSEILKTKDKLHAAEVMVKVNYGKNEYWLKVWEKQNKSNYYYFVCEKDVFYGVEHPELSIIDLLKIPQSLQAKGWMNNENFVMLWGKEQYIFNIKKNDISKLMTDEDK